LSSVDLAALFELLSNAPFIGRLYRQSRYRIRVGFCSRKLTITCAMSPRRRGSSSCRVAHAAWCLPVPPSRFTCGCRAVLEYTVFFCIRRVFVAENRVMTLRLEPELRKRLDGLAKAQRRSRSFIAAEAIRQYVAVN